MDLVSSLSEHMKRYPIGFSHWLCAADFLLSNPKELAIVGDVDDDSTKALLNAAYSTYRPDQVVAAGTGESSVPLLNGRSQIDRLPTAYVCRRFLCNAPETDPTELEKQLTNGFAGQDAEFYA